MSADEAVVRALSIGPGSSRADRTIDITTTGRRSGQPRRVEVWFHRVDGLHGYDDFVRHLCRGLELNGCLHRRHDGQ